MASLLRIHEQYILHYVFHTVRHMAKTVAVNEDTWERMRKLLDSGEAKTFDELIRRLMDQSLRLPESMFGVDRKRGVRLTKKEHEEITKDVH